MEHVLKKLMALKKGKSDMTDNEKEAKMSVIHHMAKMANDMMGDKVKSLKKVTVASDSESGLAHGLDKAKEILAHKESLEDPELDHEKHEQANGPDQDHEDDEADGKEHGFDNAENEDEGEEEHEEEALDAEHPEQDEMSDHGGNPEEDDDSAEHEEINKKLEELMARKHKLSSKKKK